MGKKKKRYRGHFCWCCERILPNQRFTGKGHARHLCRECSKLGKKELAYRQNVRNIDRCVTWEGFIRRKQRRQLESFLQHSDERTRRYAQQVAQRAEERRLLELELRREEEQAEDEFYEDFAQLDASDHRDPSLDLDDYDEEIPF